MRWLLASILLFGILAAAWGDNDAPQPAVAAARANAVDHLRSDIDVEPITLQWTVGAFLEKTNSIARLEELLAKAQQIGGPRWLDEQTCQVRMDIQAAAVRDALQQIAADNPKTSPLTSDALAKTLKKWDSRVFSATGAAAVGLEAIRPPPNVAAWKGVSDRDIRAGVAAARQQAVNRILDSIKTVPLAGGKTVGDALAIAPVGDAVAHWLGNRPVILVDFRQDRQVEVTLSVTAAALTAELRSVLAGRPDILLPADDKAWSALAEAISRQMASPVGRAKAAASTQPVVVFMPDQPPDWVDRQLDADGTAQADNKLLAARAAEEAALAKLRKQVMDLPIAGGRTMGQAAGDDPRLADRIERTLAHSGHLYNVDYQSDGTVVVRISLDLRDLWQNIASSG